MMNLKVRSLQERPTLHVFSFMFGIWSACIGLTFVLAPPSIVKNTFLYKGLESVSGSHVWGTWAMLAGSLLIVGGAFSIRTLISVGAGMTLLAWTFANAIYVTQLPDSWTSITNVGLGMWWMSLYIAYRVRHPLFPIELIHKWQTEVREIRAKNAGDD